MEQPSELTRQHIDVADTSGPSAGPSSAAASRPRGAGLSSASEHVGLAIALIILFVVLSVRAPHFLTTQNLLNVLQQVSFLAIIAWGMTLVIIAAEIDVSVGSAVAFYGALLGVLADKRGWPLIVAIIAVLVLAATVGAAAGAIRAYFNIPSFIVTLALFTALRGLALLVTNAVPQPLTDSGFQAWGSGRIWDIPRPALVMIGLFLVFWFVAVRTTYGRSVYAVGGNAEAARLSGIPVGLIRVALFATTGVLSALAGILLAASLGAGDPSVSQGLEFDVIAAVIVGGTSLYGGRGSMVGTALGVAFIGLLQNGLVLLGVNQYAQGVARGLVILVAVLVSSDRARAGFARVRRGLRDRSSRRSSSRDGHDAPASST
jgi:ribose/xylose/arabinose/galactoside ABC-type transport system permease subunit